MGRFLRSELTTTSVNLMKWYERTDHPASLPRNGLKLYTKKTNNDNEVDIFISYELDNQQGYRIKSLTEPYITQNTNDETGLSK